MKKRMADTTDGQDVHWKRTAFPRRSRLAARLMLLVFAALAAIPLVLIGGRRELVYWRVAAASRQFERGDQAGGLAALESLAGRFAEDEAIALALAGRQFDAGRLADAATTAGRLTRAASAAFESNPAAGASLLRAVSLEAQALTASGNPAEALGKLKPALATITRRVPEAGPEFVNHLAYQRALAGLETGVGLAAMESLLQKREEEPFGDVTRLTVDGRTVVAATLLAVESGQYDTVRHLVDLRVESLQAVRELMETGLLDMQIALERALPKKQDDGEPAVKEPGSEEIQATLQANNWELAVLLTARAFALERTDHPDDVDESARARHLVRRLGHDSDAILAALPDLRGCIDQIDQHAPLLDTWGLLQLRLGRLDKALNTISIACVSAELAKRLVTRRLGENPGTAIDPDESALRRKHSIAVQRIHRAECLMALGREAEAETDREFVRSLGFDPADPKLF